MKSNSLSTLIALLLSAMLAACGGGSDGGSDADEMISGGTDGEAGGDAVTRSAAGVWQGTSTSGRTVGGVVFDDGSFWFTYTAQQSTLGAGVVTGQATVDTDGKLTGVGTDYNLDGMGSRNAVLTGVVMTRQSLSVDVQVDGSSVIQFESDYALQAEQPADLAGVLGSYLGTSSSVLGAETSEVIVGGTGMLAGVSDFGCNFAGSVSPRSDINVFDVSFSFSGQPCEFVDQSALGVAWVTEQQTLTAVVLIGTDSRSALLFSGVISTE